MGIYVSGCLSCDIVAGKQVEPGGVIYENACWHVGSAIGPPVWPGFLVIKLKRHCEHLAELTPAEAALLGSLIRSTGQALTEVLQPAKVVVCSFGDGVKHVHFWALPRPPEMRPGMHSVLFNLDLRLALTRWLGLKKWLMEPAKVVHIADMLRERIPRLMEPSDLGRESSREVSGNPS